MGRNSRFDVCATSLGNLLGGVAVVNFCQMFDLSRSTFYKLMKQGEGPETYLIGRRRYVTLAAIRRWQLKQEGGSDSVDQALRGVSSGADTFVILEHPSGDGDRAAIGNAAPDRSLTAN